MFIGYRGESASEHIVRSLRDLFRMSSFWILFRKKDRQANNTADKKGSKCYTILKFLPCLPWQLARNTCHISRYPRDSATKWEKLSPLKI